MSINRVVLVGRTTAEPVAKKSQSGTTFVNFTLAINRRNDKEQTDFINCIVFGKQAEFMEQYIRKGFLVGVEGRIQTRNYENQQGQKVYVTEVICDAVQNYQPKANPSTNGSEMAHSEEFSNTQYPNSFDISSDDLPF